MSSNPRKTITTQENSMKNFNWYASCNRQQKPIDTSTSETKIKNSERTTSFK